LQKAEDQNHALYNVWLDQNRDSYRDSIHEILRSENVQ
jgi:hypothetical protein